MSGGAHVRADATGAAQDHIAPGMQSPFQEHQPPEVHAGASTTKAGSGRLFPDTAAGHMAMVCFACNFLMLCRQRAFLLMLRCCLQKSVLNVVRLHLTGSNRLFATDCVAVQF